MSDFSTPRTDEEQPPLTHRTDSHGPSVSHTEALSYAAKLVKSMTQENGNSASEDDDPRKNRRSSAGMGSRGVVVTYNSWIRNEVAQVLQMQRFDLTMGFVIMANVGVMIQETDNNAHCAKEDSIRLCRKPFYTLINQVFLAIYLVEVVLRFFVLRIEFFKDRWCLLDFVIVFCGYMDTVMSGLTADGMPGPSMSVLRIFRVLRLARVVRVFKKIPELYAMMRGFICAMQSMFWGVTMIIVLLMVWAILCVEMVHPISIEVNSGDQYCVDAFSSVWKCMLVFFQTLVAGDSWGRCTLPIIFDEPIAFVLFGSALVCVQLGFMNLILAVIVERARASEERDAQMRMKEKEKAEQKSASKLTEIFQSIDADRSGSISLEELLDGYDNNLPMQHHLGTMDIDKRDLVLLFELMDSEQEGELSYEYLINSLRMAASQDNRKHLFMLRLQASEIARGIQKMNMPLRRASEIHSMPSGSTFTTEGLLWERSPKRSTVSERRSTAPVSPGPQSGTNSRQRSGTQSGATSPRGKDVQFEKQLDASSFEKEMLALRIRLEEQHELLMTAVNAVSPMRVNGEPPMAGVPRSMKAAPLCVGSSIMSIASSLAWEPANDVGFENTRGCSDFAAHTGNDLRLHASRSEGGYGPSRCSEVPKLDDKPDADAEGNGFAALRTEAPNPEAPHAPDAMRELQSRPVQAGKGKKVGEVSL